MPLMAGPDIHAAEQFLAANGRVLDRRRYERLFHDGDAKPVRDALAAYRNPDGGFGSGLEPDGRTPATQPVAIEVALRTMDECDVWDDELVAGALDWLEANAPGEGGAVFVQPNVEGWPHAPWWVPQDGLRASFFSTGLIAATLHARGVDHPWLTRASDLLWSRIEGVDEAGAYDLRGILRFLQHVPDRQRAEAVLERIAPLVLDTVELDPDAEGEVHFPLDFAPLPDSLGRRLFDDATIAAHLDHFAASQKEDGGWTFNWLAWLPLAELEWRGSLTVDALVLLRENGRLW
jgi:hypothetical protein